MNDPIFVDKDGCRLTNNVIGGRDFAILIYPANLVARGETQLRDYVRVTKDVPPMFIAHAFDDRVPVHTPLMLTAALKTAGVPAELHVYPTGGHGYGLRPTDEPVTRWPKLAADWMRRMADYGDAENLADARALADMLRALNELPKPTIARVQGATFGGGVGLVACCDIAVASEAAIFCLSEARLGP